MRNNSCRRDHDPTLRLSLGSHHAVPLTESEMLQLLPSMFSSAKEKLGSCMSCVQIMPHTAVQSFMPSICKSCSTDQHNSLLQT